MAVKLQPAAPKGTWRNRIVGYSEEVPDQLLASPWNWRIHSHTQEQALAGVLHDIGLVQNIICNRTTQHVVDGHLRVALAISEGQPKVPVTWVELTEDEERLILATLDPLSAMAVADKEKLDELLREVSSSDNAVQELLAGLAKREGLYIDKPKDDAPEAQIDRAAELQAQWGTQLGQIWEMGCHRLVVGDCRSRAVVDALMQRGMVEMVWTDPPYGVDYEGGRNPISNKPRQKLAGDQSADLYAPCMVATMPVCKPSAPWYIWFADRAGKPVYDAIHAVGLTVRAMIIWNKLDAHYGNFMAQYMQKHEPCLYCVKDAPLWRGPSNEVTVWDVKQPTKNENHPTEKPVELAERAIRNSSKEGAIIADWFVGSGTCLIACERLGRLCRAVEVSPAYAAVTLQRWADLTGQTPMMQGYVQ